MYTRARVAPERIVERYYDAFGEARRHLEQCPRRAERADRRRSLRGWATLHTVLYWMSCVRRRAVLNRNQSAQPNWGELSAGSELRAF
ncbi:MAG TPA: hypothetical protein VMG12_31440, partial [Polyangiaceae bacterium]|nr:hypothetical protein [Polyangiaceae bacterium]